MAATQVATLVDGLLCRLSDESVSETQLISSLKVVGHGRQVVFELASNHLAE